MEGAFPTDGEVPSARCASGRVHGGSRAARRRRSVTGVIRSAAAAVSEL